MRHSIAIKRKSWLNTYRPLLVLLDAGACALAGYSAIQLWPGKAQSGFFDQTVLHWVALVALPIAWLLLLWMHGAYEGRYLGLGADEFKRVFKSITTYTAVVCFLSFTLKAELSRLAVATVLPLMLLLTVMVRFGARKALHRIRKKGRGLQRLMLLGTLGETLSVYRITTRNPYAGLQPVGICLTEATREQPALPIPVNLGDPTNRADVIERATALGADGIAVCGSRGMDPDALRRLAWQLEGSGIDLVVAPSLTNIAGPRVHIRPVEGLPLLHVEEPTISGVGWFVKGVLD
ncbi:MAG: nucleoside-diphosphate sugar epimerase/dehydratase, partial [Stenotrophomonas sp.]